MKKSILIISSFLLLSTLTGCNKKDESVKGIELNFNYQTLYKFDSEVIDYHYSTAEQLKATVLPSSCSQDIAWSSSDPSKVEVNSEGLIIAKGITEEEAVTITATSKANSDVKATCTVIVSPYDLLYFTEANLNYEDPKEFQVSASSYGVETLAFATIPSYVIYNNKQYPVTTLSDNCFYGCEVLEYVRFPTTLTTIKYGAFNYCYKLETLSIPETVESIGFTGYEAGVFYGCPLLESINVDENNKNYASKDGVLYDKNFETLIYCPLGKTDETYEIPSSVTTIGYNAFRDHIYLTKIDIPDSVTEFKENAFMGCLNLKEINIDIDNSNLKYVNNYAFSGCSSLKTISFPKTLERIGTTKSNNYAFEDCSSLTKIEVKDGCANYKTVDGILYNSDGTVIYCPSYVDITGTLEIKSTTIGDYAFINNKTITDLKLSGTTIIGYKAFNKCSALTNITLPDNGLTDIGNAAFAQCYQLENITIPKSVENLGSHVFADCYKLTDAILKGVYESIPAYSFYGCLKLANLTHILSASLESLISIDDYAFARCASLESLNFETDYKTKYLTTIGKCAFNECTSLKTVVLPSTLTTLSERAFAYCTGLNSFTINSTNLSIGAFAFYGSSLTQLEFNGTEGEFNNLDKDIYWKTGSSLKTVKLKDGKVIEL